MFKDVIFMTGLSESYLSWPFCGVTKKTEGLPEGSQSSNKDFNQTPARCQSDAVIFK